MDWKPYDITVGRDNKIATFPVFSNDACKPSIKKDNNNKSYNVLIINAILLYTGFKLFFPYLVFTSGQSKLSWHTHLRKLLIQFNNCKQI